MVYVIGKPVASLNKSLTSWLADMGTGSAIVLGIVFGLMMAFDMGGPVNKVAYALAGGVGAGYLGGLAGGLIAGLIAKWISDQNVPAALRSIMPIVVTPLLS